MESKQNGFIVTEGLILLALVGIMIGVGWFVFNSRNAANSRLDDQTKSQAEVQKTTPKTASRYLEINEWKVKLKLTSKIEDAHYNLGPGDSISISTKRLDELKSSVNTCIYAQFPIIKAKAGDKLNGHMLTEEELMKRSNQIGGFYYINSSPPPPPCYPQETPDIAEIRAIVKELAEAIKEVEAV